MSLTIDGSGKIGFGVTNPKHKMEFKCPDCGEEYWIDSDSGIDIKPMQMSCWCGYKFNFKNKDESDSSIS